MPSEQSFSSTQQIPILLSLVLFHRRSNPGSTTLQGKNADRCGLFDYKRY